MTEVQETTAKNSLRSSVEINPGCLLGTNLIPEISLRTFLGFDVFKSGWGRRGGQTTPGEWRKKSLFPQILRIIAVLFVSLRETSRKSGSFPSQQRFYTESPRCFNSFGAHQGAFSHDGEKWVGKMRKKESFYKLNYFCHFQCMFGYFPKYYLIRRANNIWC